MSLISIIIPTFNRANVIGRAIKSVLSQSYGNFELIIVNDGSTDNTGEVIASFKDKRIRYIKHITNQGQNLSLNTGVREAVGQYVAFLDSDDEWLPLFLEKLILSFNKDQSLGAVYSRAWGCSDLGELREGYPFHLQGDVYKETLMQGYLSYMITIMVKKEIIDLLTPNPFDPSFVYGQDDDFCFRVAKNCRIGLIAEPLAIIHNDGDLQGGESSICKRNDLIAEGRQRLLDKYKDDILNYCGADILASRYLSCAKLHFQGGQLKKTRSAAINSFKLNKSLRSSMIILASLLPYSVSRRTLQITYNLKCILNYLRLTNIKSLRHLKYHFRR